MPRRGRKPKPPAPIARRPPAGPDDDPRDADGLVVEAEPIDLPPCPASAARDFVAAARRSLASRGADGPEVDHVAEVLEEAVERWHVAREAIRRYGLLIPTGTGSHKPNPAVNQAAKASDQIARLLAELGLTPASAARMGAKPEADDEFDRFLAGAPG
ncbi:MAG: P27 family phage terminase small subunit [Isosphaeraceae bacterium]